MNIQDTENDSAERTKTNRVHYCFVYIFIFKILFTYWLIFSLSNYWWVVIHRQINTRRIDSRRNLARFITRIQCTYPAVELSTIQHRKCLLWVMVCGVQLYMYSGATHVSQSFVAWISTNIKCVYSALFLLWIPTQSGLTTPCTWPHHARDHTMHVNSAQTLYNVLKILMLLHVLIVFYSIFPYRLCK